MPIKLCEFGNTKLNLVAVYGFGKVPMMLITNLKSDDKSLCTAVCKVYLMRWRIEEYFKFKKQSFDLEDLRVQSLKPIRNLDLLLTIAIGYVAEVSGKAEKIRMCAEIIEVSKRLFGTPDFVYYAVADGIYEILKYVRTGIGRFFAVSKSDGQLCFFSCLEGRGGNFGES